MATKGMTLFMYFFSSGSAPNSLAITLLSGRTALLLYTQQDKEKKTGDTKWDIWTITRVMWPLDGWAYVTSLDVASPCSTCRVRLRRCAATVGSSWLRRWCSGRVSPELWNHPSVPLKNTHTKKNFRPCSSVSADSVPSFQKASVWGCGQPRRGSVNLFDVTAVKPTLDLTQLPSVFLFEWGWRGRMLKAVDQN